MSRTFFILSREIFDSAIWRDNPHTLKLFVYLIGMARHKREPKKYPQCEVKRGEHLTSLSLIAENNEYEENGTYKQWSRMKVSRMLDQLAEQGYIERICDTYGTHIKICNYETYQDIARYSRDSVVTQSLRSCDAGVTEVLPNNNGNNENNGNKNTCVELVPSSPPVITLQTNTGDEFPVTQEMHDEYSPLYPSVDVMAELRKMKAWLISNKEKRKTKRGMTRFINSWLSKAQDRGGTKQRQGNGRTYTPDKGQYEELAKKWGIDESDEGES